MIRNFEIIGEAVKQISTFLKEEHPDVPWRRIAGLRDVLIHQYMGVDPEAVRAIVGEDLPGFKRVIVEILAGMQGR